MLGCSSPLQEFKLISDSLELRHEADIFFTFENKMKHPKKFFFANKNQTTQSIIQAPTKPIHFNVDTRLGTQKNSTEKNFNDISVTLTSLPTPTLMTPTIGFFNGIKSSISGHHLFYVEVKMNRFLLSGRFLSNWLSTPRTGPGPLLF